MRLSHRRAQPVSHAYASSLAPVQRASKDGPLDARIREQAALSGARVRGWTWLGGMRTAHERPAPLPRASGDEPSTLTARATTATGTLALGARKARS